MIGLSLPQSQFSFQFNKISYQTCLPPAAATAKSLQLCPTLCDPIDGSPPGSPVSGILQARTGVGCHFLLQCVKVKSESQVSQSCPTLRDPMDCSLPGSSTHGFSRQEYWSGLPLSSPLSPCYCTYSHFRLSLEAETSTC